MDDVDIKLGTVMLIDDNKVDQLLHRRILERSGHAERLLTFYFADEALAYLRENGVAGIDMILLDINMPRMDGFEFLEAVSHEFNDDFPAVVVMLTTSLDPTDEARAAKHKIVRQFRQKPLRAHHVKELLEVIA